MVEEAGAGSQRAQPSGTTPSLRSWSMLPTLETDSSLNRPHSSCLLRQLPLMRSREHGEAEAGQAEEGGEGGEDDRGEGSSRRHWSRSLKRLLQGRQPSLSLLTLPLWPTVSVI